MATGQEMKEIFNAMTLICTEVSNLIKSINDQLDAKGFRPLGGSGVMYERSNSWNKPKEWMPYFQQKIWIKKDNPQLGIGINILFDYEDYDNKYPVVSCGYLSSNSEIIANNNDFFNIGWTDGQIVKLSKNTKFYHLKNEVIEIYSYFIPLEYLNDHSKVEKYIVGPLCDMYNSNASSSCLENVNKDIEKEIKSVEEIINSI